MTAMTATPTSALPTPASSASSTTSATQPQKNMYKVGDFVYFENSAANPYLIRRIEEIIKSDQGVNIKTQSFSRRRDIPTSLIQLADKHVRELEEELYESQWPDLEELEKHQLHHRELYMTRPSGVELLPATQIRGKCDVLLLGPTDQMVPDYLGSESNYFYTLVYDQSQRTVVTDRGDIRSGPGYQVDIPETLTAEQRKNFDDSRDLSKLETLVYDTNRLEEPNANISETDLDRFLTTAKSVGTFARALDATASTVQPILTVAASMAARDCTTQWAMDSMHDAGYELGEALRRLVTKEGPVLVRDQLESWSPSEAQLFEDGIDRYGKEFGLIRNELLPWKSHASIIEFYYMWKASDRYLAYKRTKATDQEKKLKQVYIPPLSKPSSNKLTSDQLNGVNRPCEGCCTLESENWYTWGPTTLTCRLCDACWEYWKKYGGLKMPQAQRIELMAKQQKKVPGQNDEKKTSLRASTQMNTILKEQDREASEIEKRKRLEEKQAQAAAQANKNGSGGGGDNGKSPVRSSFAFVRTEAVKQLRNACDVDAKKLARNPTEPNGTSDDTVGKAVSETNGDAGAEKRAADEQQMDTGEGGSDAKKQKMDEAAAKEDAGEKVASPVENGVAEGKDVEAAS